jgi:O-antigen/teichoic acid export membrane protein
MKLKELVGNSLWYGVVPKLSSLVSLFVLPFITPFLTPEDYGRMGLVNSYLGLAMGFCTLGLHIHLTNSFFELKNKYQPIWRRLLFLMFISSFFFAIVLFFVFTSILNIDSFLLRVLFSITAVFPLLVYPNSIIANHYYPLVSKPKAQVLRNLFGSILGIIVTFVTIRYFNFGYWGWILASAVSSLTIFLLFIKPLWIDLSLYPQVETNYRRISRLLKQSLPIIPHNLGHVLMSSSDRLIMGFYSVTVFEIGLYSNGYQIGEYANFLIMGIFTALTPVIQKAYRQSDQIRMIYFFKLSNLVISLFLFFCGLWMKDFYSFFIRNAELQNSFIIASLICFSYLANGLYVFLSSAVIIERETYKILYLVFIPALINISANLILIPFYGYKAAIYISLFSYWLVFLLPFVNVYFKNMARKLFTSRMTIVLNFIVGIVFISIAYLFRDVSLFQKIITSIIAIVFSLFYYKRLIVRYSILK